MSNCIAFTGGGSGGHVFPGLAVLEEVRRRVDLPAVWIGSRSGIERSIVESVVPTCRYYSVPSGKLRRYFSLRNFLDVFRIGLGFLWSVVLLWKLKPTVLFSKGGFVSVPPVCAAWLLRIPIITHESDLDPGLATRINARFANVVCVPYEETAGMFSESLRSRVRVTGNPVRRDLFRADGDRLRKKLGFPEGKPVLFAFGGSLGSERINDAIESILDSLLEVTCVVHQRGAHADPIADRPGYLHAAFFGEEFVDILAMSSVVVTRAGAGTLWEIGTIGVPAICVPLSTGASRGDQVRNAALFEKRGIVRVVEETELSSQRLLTEVVNLLENSDILARMKSAAESFAAGDAAVDIAEMIVRFATNDAFKEQE